MIIFLSPDNTSLWFMCEILRREESKAEYKQVKIGVFLRQFITTISSGISQKNDVSNTSRGLFFRSLSCWSQHVRRFWQSEKQIWLMFLLLDERQLNFHIVAVKKMDAEIADDDRMFIRPLRQKNAKVVIVWTLLSIDSQDALKNKNL